MSFEDAYHYARIGDGTGTGLDWHPGYRTDCPAYGCNPSKVVVRDPRPDFDTYWIGVAVAVSVRGDCSRPNGQVGAIVVNAHGRLRGAGYNGAPPGSPGCLSAGACPRAHSDVPAGTNYDEGSGACIAIHAEVNALVDAGTDNARGGTLYVTREPCTGCLKVIMAAGVARLVYVDADGNTVVSG